MTHTLGYDVGSEEVIDFPSIIFTRGSWIDCNIYSRNIFLQTLKISILMKFITISKTCKLFYN